ncbi:hypothetical protein EJB05_46140, partial [Eragrostis curvula]
MLTLWENGNTTYTSARGAYLTDSVPPNSSRCVHCGPHSCQLGRPRVKEPDALDLQEAGRVPAPLEASVALTRSRSQYLFKPLLRHALSVPRDELKLPALFSAADRNPRTERRKRGVDLESKSFGIHGRCEFFGLELFNPGCNEAPSRGLRPTSCIICIRGRSVSAFDLEVAKGTVARGTKPCNNYFTKESSSSVANQLRLSLLHGDALDFVRRANNDTGIYNIVAGSLKITMQEAERLMEWWSNQPGFVRANRSEPCDVNQITFC